MKHHWGDLLLRDHGHWDIVPNGERHRYAVADVATVRTARILTVTRDTANWHKLSSLPHLEELTLHNPTPAQVAYLSTLWRLTRLRITHARPETLAPLVRLTNVRELVLEYVSGIDDLSPIGAMPGLRALHLELLRRVKDFSPLREARQLEYLSLSGGLDFVQPLGDLSFISGLRRLEVLRLSNARVPKEGLKDAAIQPPQSLKAVEIDANILPIHDFARLTARLPQAARFKPWEYTPFNHMEVPSNDIRSRLPLPVIAANHPEVVVCDDGRRLLPDMRNGRYYLLGRGFRSIPPNDRRLQRKLADHAALYARLVDEARQAAQFAERPRPSLVFRSA